MEAKLVTGSTFKAYVSEYQQLRQVYTKRNKHPLVDRPAPLHAHHRSHVTPLRSTPNTPSQLQMIKACDSLNEASTPAKFAHLHQPTIQSTPEPSQSTTPSYGYFEGGTIGFQISTIYRGQDPRQVIWPSSNHC